MEGDSLSSAPSQDAVSPEAGGVAERERLGGCWTHAAYGLNWVIPWDFPRFPARASHLEHVAADTAEGVSPAVVVREGAVGRSAGHALNAGPFRRADDSGCVWLQVPGTATFAVRGLEVVVDNEVGGDPVLRDFVLAGPVAALVIRNAGMVPVRGAAVRDGDLAALILGVSAIGVSTLAGALIARGLQLVGDETLALIPRAGRLPLVAAGGSTLQLPSDSEAALRARLGVEGVPLRTSASLPRLDIALSVDHDSPELAAIYVLDAEATTEVSLTPIAGLDRMEAVQAADWHRVLRREQGFDSDDFVAAAAVTSGVAMRKVSRLDGPDLHVGDLSRLVRRDFQAVSRTLRSAT